MKLSAGRMQNKMKLNRIISAAAALMLVAAVMTGCGEKPNYSSPETSTSANSETLPDVESEPTEPVKAAADGPRLYVKDTTAAPGEVAEVTIAIENAERKWSMCGFHITYPNVLKPEMMNDEERLVKKKVGEAAEYNVGNVCMEWRENLDEYLVSNNLGSTFFCATFENDYGMDGDVLTLFLKIPDDAVSGTEYPVDFFYIEGDMFQNFEKDEAMEKYVFENWKGGKITVK